MVKEPLISVLCGLMFVYAASIPIMPTDELEGIVVRVLLESMLMPVSKGCNNILEAAFASA
jgi:hypothetical protein